MKRTQMKNNEKIWKLEYLEPLVHQGSYEEVLSSDLTIKTNLKL